MAGIQSHCWDCNETFPSRNKLRCHRCPEFFWTENSNYNEDGTYTHQMKECPFCNDEFNEKYLYYRHMMENRGCPGQRAVLQELTRPRRRSPPPSPSPAPPTPPLTPVEAVEPAVQPPIDTGAPPARVPRHEACNMYTEKRVQETEAHWRRLLDFKDKELDFRVKEALEEQKVKLEGEHKSAIQKLEDEHESAAAKFKGEHKKTIAKLGDKIADMEKKVEQMKVTRDEAVEKWTKLELELRKLEAVRKSVESRLDKEIVEAVKQEVTGASERENSKEEATRTESTSSNIPAVVCSPPVRGHRPVFVPHTNDTITVHVGTGQSKETFRVSRAYITEVSSVFEGCFKKPGNMPESVENDKLENEMKIYDFAPSTFRIFRDWLLGRRLPARYSTTDVSKVNSSINNSVHMNLVQLYLFAFVYDVPQLRRDALDAYMRHLGLHGILPTAAELLVAYETLLPDSPMIKFMVNFYATMWDGVVLEKDEETWMELPADFYMDLAIAGVKMRAPQGRFFAFCEYHEHS